MGLIDFVKEAGEKLCGHGTAQAAMKEAASRPADASKAQAANAAAGDAILRHINAQNLTATGLTVTFDGASGTASVFGVAPDHTTRETIVLCCSDANKYPAIFEANKPMLSPMLSSPDRIYPGQKLRILPQ